MLSAVHPNDGCGNVTEKLKSDKCSGAEYRMTSAYYVVCASLSCVLIVW